MPAPTAFGTAFTGTPDNSTGVAIGDITAQDGTNKLPIGVQGSDRIASSVSADRSALAADDTGTTDMSTVAFAGSAGANLIAINNRGSIVVWCDFPNSAGSATVEIVYYDAANNPLFIGEQLTFSAKTQRLSASGNYMSQSQVVDSYGASKYRPFLRTKGTGNVDIYSQPI